jgi:hypothetical protein
MIKKLHFAFSLVLLLGSINIWAQGTLTNPVFSENFGTLANTTAITTSNTVFSYVRVGTSSSGTNPNEIIAKNPGSFTGSSCLIGAKGTSVSTVDKTGLTSFSSGTYVFRFKTPSTLTSAIMFSGVGTGSSFGSASGFTGAQLSSAFQVNGTNLQIRAASAWTTVQTVATSTSYTVCVVFNNTAGSLSYGSSMTLPSNKCHVWVNGTYINEYSAATSNLAASAFRIYTTTCEFEVDDIAVYSSLPANAQSISVTGSFTPFSTLVGTPSASQSVAVSGTNLTSNIEVAALSGYEYSTTDAAPWTSTLSLASSFNGNVYVRLTGASVGAFSGNVSFTSTGATQVNKAVSGNVNPLTPVINVTGSFSAFSTTIGTSSASQSVVVSGSNLTSGIDVSAVTGFEYSTTDAAPWTSTLSLASGFSGNVYVRLTGASIGSPSGTISFTSTGATQVDKSVSGTVTAPPPVITVTGSFTSFSATMGTPSVSQSVTVSSSNLTAGISVTAVPGYEYSITDAAPWTSSLSLSSSFSGSVYVRLTAASGGSYSGTISFTSTGAPQVDKTVSGTVNCASAAFPFIDNFDYTIASKLTDNCWAAHSGAGSNPIAVAANSISYPDYLSSGIGNEVAIGAAGGEDVNRTFTAQTSGSVYASFLVNVTSSKAAGDYFFHLGETPVSSIFDGRIFIKKDASTTNFAFGLNKAATAGTLAYTGFNYVPGTTYLVVLKYTFNTGSTTDDAVSLYVNPVLNAVEPSPLLTVTDAASADLTKVDFVALRQGNSSNSPALKFDGLRVSTVWTDIVGEIPPASTTWNGSINNNWHLAGNWSDGIPGAITDVTIPAGLSNYPTLSSAGTCHDITLGSSAAGTASILDNSHLTVTGTATVEHYITTNKYHGFSTSVTGATAEIFHLLGQTGLDVYLYSHNEADNGGPSAGYTEITSGSTPLVPMAGYSVYADGVHATPPKTAWTFVEQGNLNTGSFGSANNLTTTVGSFSGFNYVGNPYPSAIDWDATSGWSKTNVNNAIYIEENTGWATYIGGVGTGSPAGTRYIAPGQGFFVQASAALGTLTMNNNIRVHNAVPYLKDAVSDMLRLQVSGNGYIDDAVVRFLPDATPEFDGNYDAHKLFGETAEVAQIYTLGGTELAINTLPETGTVPVGVKAETAGIYTISATEVHDMNNVVLEDTKTGKYTDLLKGSYSCSLTPDENEQRFILHFGPLAISEVENSIANVYSNSRTVYVDLKNSVKGDIFIYTVAGQLVASKLSANGMNEMILANTGNYIVKVISSQNTMVKKVWIQ